MGKFINPFTDFGFHRIFGQEVHKELLIDFLNQLLKDERHIIDITFLNPIQQPETIEDRGVIFDIHCRDDKGGWFVVEMQNGAQPYFYDRGIYYLSRAISNQGEKGKDWKFSLCPVYGIFLLNYKMGIPMDTLERMPFKARKAVFDKLLEVADVANLSKDERILYDEALKRYRDYKNTIDYAEEKGVEKGIKIGKTEEQRLIAANLKKRGVNTEMIAQCTGLSIEEIDNL